jgi:hypothetical protein
VTPYEDQFREAFESHEHLAPEMGAVYNGSQVLFRKYLRRRRSAQVVSGAVLGAGLLAAGTNLPAGLLPGATVPGPAISTTPPAAVPPVPTSLSDAELGRDVDAFAAAGYGYNDAVQLAAIWHTRANVGFVKAEGGRLLLAGQTLPIRPHPDPPDMVPSDHDADAQQKFWAAGYDADDAEKLARLWHVSLDDAKVKGGEKLLAGDVLPIRP